EAPPHLRRPQRLRPRADAAARLHVLLDGAAAGARMSGRHIVVTGGAGFIGSHLADRLLRDGNRGTAIANLATAHPRKIEHPMGNSSFRFIKHDVVEYVYVDGDVEAILHLASLPSPVDYLRKPIPTLKVGALGTHKVLGLARAKRARFLLASTSEVYGDPQVH